MRIQNLITILENLCVIENLGVTKNDVIYVETGVCRQHYSVKTRFTESNCDILIGLGNYKRRNLRNF